MGFSFNFFGKQEVRKFSYKPRFYDPEKEARRKRYGNVAKQEAAEKEEYKPGMHVRGSLRDGNYSHTEEIGRNQKIIDIRFPCDPIPYDGKMSQEREACTPCILWCHDSRRHRSHDMGDSGNGIFRRS